MDLVKNHEKMIQFKNKHKTQQLWEENKCLQQDRALQPGCEGEGS